MPDLDPRIILAQRQLPTLADMQDEQQKRQIQEQEVELRRQEIMARRDAIVAAAQARSQKAAAPALDPAKQMEASKYRVFQAEQLADTLDRVTKDPSLYPYAKQHIAATLGDDVANTMPPEYDPEWTANTVAVGRKAIAAEKSNLVPVDTVNDAGEPVRRFVAPTPNLEVPLAPKSATTGEAKPGTLEYYMTSTYGPNPTPEQQRQGRKDFNQADDRPTRVTVNTGGIGANIPGDFTKTGDEFLTGIPPQWRSTVKKIANYDEDPTKVASMRGGLRETLMTWVNQVNPAYDQSQFALRSPTRRAFTTGTQGQQINAINTAIGHIDQLTTLADQLQNGGFTPGNKAWNTIRTAFGSDKVTNFDTLKDALAGEVSSVLAKGGATVSGIAEAKDKINAANSPTQLAGYVKTLIPIMGSKLGELNYQYHQAMGADDTYSALSPQSKAILSKHGFDPESPQIGSSKTTAAPAIGAMKTFPNGRKGKWDGQGWELVP